MKIKSRLWRRIGVVLGAVAFASSVGMVSNAASVSAQSSLATLPDWNYYCLLYTSPSPPVSYTHLRAHETR